ncbi:MAG: DUF3696 domain-containing protein [Gammaproteobacteria bacterium]|nr:DUF3696 domain-containing protein [Gammaproteobacteria bacterium]
MLQSIRLKNFKCFECLKLACAPLTLLCGMNGMGKSSVLQALLVLRQSALSGELGKGRLVLGGELADLGTGRDVLCEGAETNTLDFELRDNRTSESCRMSFEYSRDSDQLSASQASQDFGGEEWRDIPPLGGQFFYVSAERIGPRKIYDRSDVLALQSNLGTRGEYAWNYLYARQTEMLAKNDPRRPHSSVGRQLLSVVDHWLQEITPGAHIGMDEVSNADAVIAGFSFDRPGDVPTLRYRATNVGFGLSYTLPVFMGLLAPPNALCLIENPEAHLHPHGQTKLAELAARAALAGVQVIVETHSDHFMDGVRIAVREGLIQSDQTAFHYFERAGAKTVVSSPRLGQDGRLSEWPAGFFDQHEQNLARLLAPKV